MSLRDAAQHLAAQGRGPDDKLIHMSGKELAGLQTLAKAHGGSLTINPETGLAEAGFLDNILPAVIGAGAMYLSGGMINPMTAGLGVGGFEALRTGDLGKGLMAGLGAYGGAGALEGLAGLGEAGSGFANQSMGENLAGGFEMAKANPSAALSAVGGKNLAMAAAPAIMGMMAPQGAQAPQGSDQMIRPYTFAMNPQTQGNMVGGKPMVGTTYQPGQDTSERMYFQPQYTALAPYKAAGGGLMSLARTVTGEDVMPTEREEKMAGGGPVEQMSNANAIGANTGYPMANINKATYSAPYQTPVSQNVVQGDTDTGVNPMTGEMTFAAGGISTLGGYAAGGNPRLLKGPGDGMSDNIPAMIGEKQPARLADGEFVIPADVVSHLGNGSTDAGAKQLYKMMDRIRQQRTGKKKQAPEVNPSRAMPA
jgi:hypothetical protein